MPWGAGIEEFPELTEYKAVGGIKYYQKSDMGSADCDVLAGLTSSHVAYGFKNNQLYARLVRIDTLEDFDKVHDHLVDLYGEPEEKMDNTTHIDRWKSADLKIKLKYNKDTKLMKLGTYHVPSAGKEFDVEKSFDAAP
jgi:transcription-repair coupling factor (superfamily II helicase)